MRAGEYRRRKRAPAVCDCRRLVRRRCPASVPARLPRASRPPSARKEGTTNEEGTPRSVPASHSRTFPGTGRLLPRTRQQRQVVSCPPHPILLSPVAFSRPHLLFSLSSLHRAGGTATPVCSHSNLAFASIVSLRLGSLLAGHGRCHFRPSVGFFSPLLVSLASQAFACSPPAATSARH